MKKRIMAATLIIALLLGSLAAAEQNVEQHTKVMVSGLSGTAISKQLDYEDDIEMKPGEHRVVGPLCWVDSNYLSYDVVSLTSDSPNVVTAEPYITGSREEMGISLYAGSEGVATIEMMLRTYPTKEGLNAKDERTSDTVTFYLYVHVIDWDAPFIQTEMRIGSSNLKNVKEILFYTSDAFQELPDEDRNVMKAMAVDAMGAWLGADNLDGFDSLETTIADRKASDIATGTASGTGAVIESKFTSGGDAEIMVDTIHDDDPRYVTPTDRKKQDIVKQSAFIRELRANRKVQLGRNLYLAGTYIGKAFTRSSDLNIIAAASLKGVRRKATYIPTYHPKPLTLYVTLTNPSPVSMTVDSLTLQCNEFLSFESSAGPWGNNYTLGQKEFSAGETLTFPITVYARPAYGDLKDTYTYHKKDESTRFAYTGRITLDCQYTVDLYGQTGTAGNSIALDAYSNITKEEMQKYARAMNYNLKYYQKHYGAENLAELLYFGCPVDIIIQNKDGAELAVIQTGDDEVFESEGLFAAANGEDKIVAIFPEATDLYRVFVHVLEDGTMDVIASGADAAGELDANVYEETPISAGNRFELRLSGESAGKLYALQPDGSVEEAEPTMRFNRESIIEDLAEGGISGWAVEPASAAISNGLIPEIACDSFQEAVATEDFCAMLLNVYEAYYGLESGETISNYADLHTGEAEFTAVDVAVSLGIIPEEFLSGDRQFGDGISRSTAAEWLQRFVRRTLTDTDILYGLVNYDKYLYYLNDEYRKDVKKLSGFSGKEEEIEKILNTYASITPPALEDLAGRGIMRRDLGSESDFSYEEALAAIGETWDYLNRCFKRNDLILTAVENASETLERVDYTLSAAAKENRNAEALNSFRLHFPAMPRASLDMDMLNGAISNFANLDIGNLNPAAAKPDDLKLEMFSCASGMMISDPGICGFEFAPVYYPDGKGGILDDTIYLAIVQNTVGMDEEILKQTGEMPQGNYTLDWYLITDQDIVEYYLELMHPAIERYNEPTVEREYPELAKGSRGEEAKALQQALIQKGYLIGSADGIFGNMTAEAVSAFQTAMSIEATGIADNETQKLLFVAPNQKQLLLDWIDSRN